MLGSQPTLDHMIIVLGLSHQTEEMPNKNFFRALRVEWHDGAQHCLYIGGVHHIMMHSLIRPVALTADKKLSKTFHKSFFTRQKPCTLRVSTQKQTFLSLV